MAETGEARLSHVIASGALVASALVLAAVLSANGNNDGRALTPQQSEWKVRDAVGFAHVKPLQVYDFKGTPDQPANYSETYHSPSSPACAFALNGLHKAKYTIKLLVDDPAEKLDAEHCAGGNIHEVIVSSPDGDTTATVAWNTGADTVTIDAQGS